MYWKMHSVLGRVSGIFDMSVGLYTVWAQLMLEITFVKYLNGATILKNVPYAELQWKNQLRTEVTSDGWNELFYKI